MPVGIGTTLGSYEITALLGKGGMGEVYRARDTRLKRDVAIKTLPDEFGLDPDRINRFQREAELLASLNHPNIAGIHDLLDANGARFLVLELVEGETLADRLDRGPLPIDDALHIARQVCDALEAAHEKDIVHRDLKPANIKLGAEHAVKVLDFGLAKVLAQAGAGSSGASLENSPTLTSPVHVPRGSGARTPTHAGIILGTAAYMSPEQARGLSVDARSDIFSFGCVFFEMLTGKRAFPGDTISDILAAILKSDPDFTALPADLDPRLKRLLERALNKNHRQRWQAIGDVRIEIEQAIAHPAADASRTGKATAPRRSVDRLAWPLAAASVVAAIVLGTGWVRSRSSDGTVAMPVFRLSVNAPEGSEISPGQISPDGTRVIYSTLNRSGSVATWIRHLNSGEIRATDMSGNAFWSPDSRSVAFFTSGKLMKAAVDGGTPQVLADAPTARGGTWNQQNVILFQPRLRGPLVRIAATGGTPVPLTQTAGLAPSWPVFLPDGNHFLFFNEEARHVHVGSLDSEEIRALPSIRSRALYSPPSHLLFTEQSTLLAQRFDLSTLSLVGEPVRIADQVAYRSTIGFSHFSVSANGVVVYVEGSNDALIQITWYDRTGEPSGTIGKPDTTHTFRFSPDQTRLALDRSDPLTGKRDIWVIDDIAAGIATRITADPGAASTPVWSPDGRRILFRSDNVMKVIDSNGNATGEPLKDDGVGQLGLDDWSSDGRYVLQRRRSEETQWDIRLIPTTGGQPASWFLRTPFNEGQARVSPNAKWIAYTSDESGRPEIYVQSFPTPGNKRRISTDGGVWPRWRRDGTELFYVAEGTVMSASVNTGDAFTTKPPVPLFRSPNALVGSPIGTTDPFEVSLDGRRFLLLANTRTSRSSMPVILNWPSLLPR